MQSYIEILYVPLYLTNGDRPSHAPDNCQQKRYRYTGANDNDSKNITGNDTIK